MAETDQKTEEPTPQRRRDAREKGQVPFSQELMQGALLLAGVMVLWLGLGVADGMRRSMRFGLATLRTDLVAFDVPALAADLGIEFLRTVGPLLAAVFVTALLLGLIQSGGNISIKALAPDIGKLSMIKGISRIFSSRSVMRTASAILKLIAVMGIAAYIALGRLGSITPLGRGELDAAVGVGWSAACALGLSIAGALTVIGVLDFFYQRWKNEQELRMSRQEVKDDHKQEEGDPMIRARLRKLQRERATGQMLKEVPEATVVVTNPTHISVALKYDRETMAAPIVVAKGADRVALRIREVAREHDVPVVERRPVARALYASAEIGEEIPLELYQAVAEILTYIYGLKRAG